MKFQAEEAAPNVERRSSPGYGFRQRYLQDIISAIEPKDTEGESQRVRVPYCCSFILIVILTLLLHAVWGFSQSLKD